MRPIRRSVVMHARLSFTLFLSLSLSPCLSFSLTIYTLHRTNSVLIGTIPAACFPLESLTSKYLIARIVKEHTIQHSFPIVLLSPRFFSFFIFFFFSLAFPFNFTTANAARIVCVRLTPSVKYLHVRVAYR